MTDLEKFRMAQPAKEPFDLPMVANSTTEVAVDVATGIDAGEGWAILGWYYSFRTIAAPHEPRAISLCGAQNSWVLQLCRGQAPATPALLDPHDDDLIWEDIIQSDVGTSANTVMSFPRMVNCAEVTIQDSCYFCFGTVVDDAEISDAAYAIMGVLLYEELGAPNLGQGKGGYLGNL
jgi:hypothetical protein